MQVFGDEAWFVVGVVENRGSSAVSAQQGLKYLARYSHV
jgi:hypothetical protein